MYGFNMNEFNELSKSLVENSKKTRAFENSSREIKSPRHISTINESCKGMRCPGTSVYYASHTFQLHGERVEGVFPKFNSKFDVRLPKHLHLASDTEQFKFCTARLKEQVSGDPFLANRFTPHQIEQINDGAPRISGLTWHHNEVTGKMQLVNALEHSMCRHTGGRALWGGGLYCR